MQESNIPNVIKHLRTMALRASLPHDVTVALNEASDCVEYLLAKLPSDIKSSDLIETNNKD